MKTWLAVLLLFSCSSAEVTEPDNEIIIEDASVTAVTTSGESGEYRFSVTISSPDTGCEQYANWWEVVSSEETLLYRRILAHSHVDEQPFTRSGGPVSIKEDEEVWVRVHMNNTGYSTFVMKGSVKGGFESATVSDSFGSNLAQQNPQPGECPF